MVAPPLPLANDFELNTCPHGYPAESCDVIVDVVPLGAEYRYSSGGHR